MRVAKKSREQMLLTLTPFWRDRIAPIKGMTPSRAAELANVNAGYAIDIMRGQVEKPDADIVARLIAVVHSCPTCHRPWLEDTKNESARGRERRAQEET